MNDAPLPWRISDRFPPHRPHYAVRHVRLRAGGVQAHRAPCVPSRAASFAGSSACGCENPTAGICLVSRPTLAVAHGHEDSLLLVDRLELDGLISVLPPARRASAVEVLLDVVPAELADLQRAAPRVSDGSSSELGRAGRGSHLVTARARLEVEIGNVHLLQTKRALCILLIALVQSLRTTCTDTTMLTASSSLQYASCTPART